jgi:hypothetical protein
LAEPRPDRLARATVQPDAVHSAQQQPPGGGDDAAVAAPKQRQSLPFRGIPDAGNWDRHRLSMPAQGGVRGQDPRAWLDMLKACQERAAHLQAADPPGCSSRSAEPAEAEVLTHGGGRGAPAPAVTVETRGEQQQSGAGCGMQGTQTNAPRRPRQVSPVRCRFRIHCFSCGTLTKFEGTALELHATSAFFVPLQAPDEDSAQGVRTRSGGRQGAIGPTLRMLRSANGSS